MKRLFISLIAITMVFTFSANQLTAKEFKGVITYKVTYPGSDIPDEMRAYLPKTMSTAFSGSMSRTEMFMGMGKTIVIKNGDDKSTITLIDMMGQKFAIKATPEDIADELEDQDPGNVEIVNETKEILGYVCKKAIVTFEDKDDKFIAYFTDELGINGNYFDTPEYRGIEGILMEFEIHTEEFTMHFTASSVDKKKIPESDFEIPEDYEIKTQEELEGMFGGGM